MKKILTIALTAGTLFSCNLTSDITKESRLLLDDTVASITVNNNYIPIQILVTRQLSKTENLWLSHLTNQLDGEPDAELLVEEYQKHTKDKLYQSVMDIIVRANHEMFEEAKEMCDALRELFADEFKENRQEGLQEGRSEINRLILKLSELGRTDDILKAAQDPAYQEQLLKELHL